MGTKGSAMKIDSFSGKYRFLSNFYSCNVEFEGLTYPSTENAYQAAKTLDRGLRKQFQSCTASSAKKGGRYLPLRKDWEQVKVGIMVDLLRKKFARGAIRDQLLATNDAELIEGNTWGDRFWGVCNGVGENMLGKLLMQVRDELRKCSDGCGASSEDHCWNKSTSDGEDITVGDVVSFDERDKCIAYSGA